MVANPARRGQLNWGAQKTRLIFHQKRAYVAATFFLGSIELVIAVFARTSVCRLYLGMCAVMGYYYILYLYYFWCPCSKSYQVYEAKMYFPPLSDPNHSY